MKSWRDMDIPLNCYGAKLVHGRGWPLGVLLAKCSPNVHTRDNKQLTLQGCSCPLGDVMESGHTVSEGSPFGVDITEALIIALDSTLKHKNGFISERDAKCPREAES